MFYDVCFFEEIIMASNLVTKIRLAHCVTGGWRKQFFGLQGTF